MKTSFSNPIGRVRIIGWIEGLSFLLLLGVAMPLKYFAGMPMGVRLMGWAHGGLFVGLMCVVYTAWRSNRLSFGYSSLAVVASLIPGGPFMIDRLLAMKEAEDNGPSD